MIWWRCIFPFCLPPHGWGAPTQPTSRHWRWFHAMKKKAYWPFRDVDAMILVKCHERNWAFRYRWFYATRFRQADVDSTTYGFMISHANFLARPISYFRDSVRELQRSAKMPCARPRHSRDMMTIMGRAAFLLSRRLKTIDGALFIIGSNRPFPAQADMGLGCGMIAEMPFDIFWCSHAMLCSQNRHYWS